MGVHRATALAIVLLLAIPLSIASIPFAGAVDEKLDPVDKIDELPSGGEDFGALAVCPTSAAPEILTSGVASQIGNDTTTADCHYKINVANPAGMRLRAVVTWTGASDHDVYVKAGTPATVSPYYCSEVGTSTASPSQCTSTAALVAGDYFIRVKRWNGLAEFVLTVFIEVPPPTCSFTGTGTLVSGVTRSDSLTTDAGANCQYSFTPADELTGGDLARLTLVSPAASNFDLYVKRGSAPTTTTYDCRSILTTTGGTDTCTVDVGLPVFVMVIRTSGSGSFTILADQVSSCGLGPGVHPLLAGSNSGSLLGLANAKCYFQYAPSTSVDFARYVLPPTTPSDFDMYVKAGALPTTTSYDCRPYLGGSSAETCELLAEGPQFVMVRRFSGPTTGGSFTLNVSEVVVPLLENGVPVAGVSAPGAMNYYKVVVPAQDAAGNAPSALAIAIAGGAEDAACSAVEAQAAGACATASTVDDTACDLAEGASPGACDGAPGVSIARSNADLYVRHRAGLPTTTVNDCKATGPGSVGACVFSTEARNATVEAAAAYAGARAELVANCPGPTLPCANPPVFPTLPTQAGLVPFKGAGKYFVAVRGASGTGDYVIAAAYA